MALTVTFDGSNFTLAEAADDANWADRGGGTGSAQDLDSPLEGAGCRGRKVDNTTLGFAFQRTTIDLSAAGEHLAFWQYCGTRNVLDTKANGGMRVRLGGGADPDTSPWAEWNVNGDDTVPPTNKWMRVWFDVDRGSPDALAGTFLTSDVESFGGNFTASAAITGNVKNFFMDRIDRMQGSGGLTGTGTGGIFEDFLAFDVDISTNRVGVVERIPGGIQLNARLTIGTSSSAVLNDSALNIIFDDQQFCESDFMGLTFDLQNVSTDIDLADIKISSAGSVNIGDILVTGTSGDLDFIRMTIANLRFITLTSVCTVSFSQISAVAVITQSGARIEANTLSAQTTADTAADRALIASNDLADIVDNSFDLTDTHGHAIEGTQTGAIALVGNKYTGYFSVTNQTLHQFDNTSDVNSGTDEITLPAGHGYVDGDPVVYSKVLTANTIVSGLADETTYWVAVTTNVMTLHNSEADALVPQNAINLTAGTGNETHALWPGDAAFFNDAGGATTLNISGGGDTPSVRNGLDTTTIVNNTVTVTIGGITEGAAVKVLAAATVGSVTLGDILLEALANSSGQATFAHNYEGDLAVIVRAAQQGIPNAAIADDGGVQTDETTEANSTTTADVNLLPTVGVAGDAYYFGHAEKFGRIKVDVTQLHDGSFRSFAWEYFNGSIFTALSNLEILLPDGTTSSAPNNVWGSGALGRRMLSWDIPGDWAKSTENSQGPFFFVRFRLTGLSGATQGALARKATMDVTRYINPGDLSRTILATGLNVIVPWNIDTFSNFHPTDS